MGKNKKGFNWKARAPVEVKTDDSSNAVTVEFETNQKYDESNPLVLPSKKRTSEVTRKDEKLVKKLSRKQRKHLEKIVEKKKKKKDRASLLKSLSEVQGTPELLSKLTSISEVQTKGIKRLYEDCDEIPKTVKLSEAKKQKINCIKGREKTKNFERTKYNDPSILGFTSSESDSDEDSDDIDQSESEPVPDTSESQVVNDTQSSNSPDQSVNPEEINISDTEPDTTELITKSSKTETQTTTGCLKSKPIIVSKPASESTKNFVSVNRKPEIDRTRRKLPIIDEEQIIMEAISDNDVVIIAGETGSGKTTQLPQFLYEAGYTLDGRVIGVTEPRRVAAISMSRRVAEELNLDSSIVSYLIRFEGNAGPETRIKFMTDGVLLKEMCNDFELSKYSVIILDEAHERSIYTDILIGMLSRNVALRRKKGDPLKLIIMSATLRLSEFTENTRLFKTPPPVIKVNGRQFPVSIHFNKKTAINYVKEAYKKACKIHTQLPEGGILIFLTGQQEVNFLVRKLRQTFPYRFDKKSTARVKSPESSTVASDPNDENEVDVDDKEENNDETHDSDDDDEIDYKNSRKTLKKVNKNLPEINLEDYATKPNEDDLEDDDELDDDFVTEPLTGGSFQSMWVLPLYSLLDSKKQIKVFNPPPEGCRLCVVATNVAETSLTIPKIKYVIDSGRTKERLYDKMTGVTTYQVTWTSKASADQRAGRAGRTSTGHCYRLYSSAVYNDQFQQWSVPEIQRKPIDDVMLQMKSLGLSRVVNFPFPSPPDTTQLQVAEKRLQLLGAVERPILLKDELGCKITPLGKIMARFPVLPRFAKMLCLSNQFDLLPYTIAIVAALSVQEFLLQPNENLTKIWKTWAKQGNRLLLGDIMVLLMALGSAEYASTKGNMEKFCLEHGLRWKAVLEARKIRVQLTNECNEIVPDLNLGVDPEMKPPTDDQAVKLRQIMLSGMADQVAYKLSANELKEIGLPAQKAAYRKADLSEVIFLNSSSVLRTTKPEWIVYQEVYQTNDKLYARGITAIEPEWLPIYAPRLCHISEPLKYPPPQYESTTGRVMCYVNSSFGRSGWQLPVSRIEFPEGADRYKWFALFFLQGDICPKIQKYVEHFLFRPDTMFKEWAKSLDSGACSRKFIAALMEKRVYNKDTLLEKWQNDETYLLEQYIEWLPKSTHEEIKRIWPPK